MEYRILEKAGLTKNESIVYVTLLKIGTTRTGVLLNESGLNSGKIYEILESLKNKGLVSESIVNNIKHFTAAAPTQLIDYLNTRRQEIESDIRSVQRILPELENIRKVGYKEIKAAIFTGIRGLKTAADEALESMKKGEELLVMGVTQRKNPEINEFWKRWQQNRIRKKIKSRMIFSERSNYQRSYFMLPFIETRVVSGITPAAVDIFGEDQVLILNYEDPPTCVLIHDQNTVKSFKQFFEQIWEVAKP